MDDLIKSIVTGMANIMMVAEDKDIETLIMSNKFTVERHWEVKLGNGAHFKVSIFKLKGHFPEHSRLEWIYEYPISSSASASKWRTYEFPSGDDVLSIRIDGVVEDIVKKMSAYNDPTREKVFDVHVI